MLNHNSFHQFPSSLPSSSPPSPPAFAWPSPPASCYGAPSPSWATTGGASFGFGSGYSSLSSGSYCTVCTSFGKKGFISALCK